MSGLLAGSGRPFLYRLGGDSSEVGMLSHDTILRSANQLQPLPPSCARLAALVVEDVPDLNEVTDIVSYDPVLTARLLRVANSVLSAPTRSIGTVREAVIRLGTGSVLGLVVGASVQPTMEKVVPGYGLSTGVLWRHSVASALAVEVAKDFCLVPWSPLYFTAALLHDIGKLVLGHLMTPGLSRLCHKAVEEGGLEPFQAESEILTVHHGEVGEIVAQHWRLPEDIVKGVGYHHAPGDNEDRSGFVACLGNLVAKQIEGHPIRTEAEQKIFETARDRLGFTDVGFEKICEATAIRLVRVGRQYGH